METTDSDLSTFTVRQIKLDCEIALVVWSLIYSRLGTIYVCFIYGIILQIKLGCEIALVVWSLAYIFEALYELSFLGTKIWVENMGMCPSRYLLKHYHQGYKSERRHRIV